MRNSKAILTVEYSYARLNIFSAGFLCAEDTFTENLWQTETKCFCQKEDQKSAWLFVHKVILCRFVRNYLQFFYNLKNFVQISIIAKNFGNEMNFLQAKTAKLHIIMQLQYCPSSQQSVLASFNLI